MSGEEAPGRRAPQWSGDAGAERLFTRVREACADGSDFPTRLEASLRAALEMLATDPELAYQLTVEPHLGSDGLALDAQRGWIARFGDLLREAVAGDPRSTTSQPRFLASFLIGGVRFQIARLVLSHEAADLGRLLPGLLEALLAYYFEPSESGPLARAALGG